MSNTIITLLCVIALLTGCHPAEQKTLSMLQLEQAQRQAAEKITNANTILAQINAQNLAEHLDELLLVRELLEDAKEVFAKRNIMQFSMPQMQKLESELAAWESSVANQLRLDLQQAIELTKQYREQITKIKTKPYGARENHADQLVVQRLSADYNKALDSCCSNRIAMATKLLMYNKEKYNPIKKVGLNLGYYMEEMIRSPETEQFLQTQLTSENQVF